MSISSKTIVGGLVATAAMTILMVMAPMMGMPPMNIGAMLAGMMGVPTLVGWAMHFMIGLLFAFGYTYFIGDFIGDRLPIPNVFVRGMVYGFLVFLVAQLMFFGMRAMGLMPEQSGSQLLALLGSLMGHLLYGGVLGVIATPQKVSSHAHA